MGRRDPPARQPTRHSCRAAKSSAWRWRARGCCEPRLLLLDEPTANLDGAAREQVIALIPDLDRGGGSVVIACHDRDLISLPGVRRLKLRDGRLGLR